MSTRLYERNVIGGALLEPSIVDAANLAASDFSDPWARRAWESLTRLALNGDPVTEITIADDSGLSVADLSETTAEGIMPSQTTWYANAIRQAAHRRRLEAACKEAIARLSTVNGVDPLPEVASLLASALDAAPASQEPCSLESLVSAIIEDLPRRREIGKPGLTSGFPKLDYATGGLRPGSLFVVAAHTGVGKSLFAANVCRTLKLPSLMFSLEMAGLEVAERIIAAASGVDAISLQRGQVDPDDVRDMRDRSRDLRHVFIDDRPAPNLTEITATARAFVRREKVRFIVVDYLQIVRTEQGERREAEVASIARGLRAMARNLDVPVLALAQLNRDGDVRDSAVIEQEAHVVCAFERKKGAEDAVLDIRKNRHGPELSINLRFDKRTLVLHEKENQ